MYQFHVYSNLEDRFVILRWVGGSRWQRFRFRIVIPCNEFIFRVCTSNICIYSMRSCKISYFQQHVSAANLHHQGLYTPICLKRIMIHLSYFWRSCDRASWYILKYNQLHALISQIYFWNKIYMFRTAPLSVIRSSSLYTQQWCMSYRFADRLRAGSGRNREKLPMMSRGTVRNI